MAKKERGVATNGSTDSEKTRPRSAAFFDRGITDDITFANMSLAVCGDLISGLITPSVGNAVCANARNVLKVHELRLKYGLMKKGEKVLRLEP